ncbi:MBL fold metallo-hydrolase [Cupriavidus sp. 2KB_3]|uniref:MBL fold metallo-hydrolase n=1 Tax=Cupriavidus sp. 2KB_3 TaxID=3232980 RepID=UPI003F934FBC
MSNVTASGRAANLLLSLSLLGAPLTVALAQNSAETPYDKINAAAAASSITTHALRGGVSMLEGSGGNIGVLSGPEGLLLVDCGIAVSQKKIEAALQKLSKGQIRYAVLTHWHWDHADGNGWVRRQGAQLMATGESIKRLSQTIRVEEWGHTFSPVPTADLPNVSLDGAKTLNFAGESVIIRPYSHSHTDGDVSVYFQRADILVTGDTYWNGMYPFIDYMVGGSIDGMIEAAKANIEMATQRSIVIPGHGPVSDRSGLVAFHDMLVDVRKQVAALKAKGLSLQEVQAAKPTAAYDGKWGQSIISGGLFTALVYRGV